MIGRTNRIVISGSSGHHGTLSPLRVAECGNKVKVIKGNRFLDGFPRRAHPDIDLLSRQLDTGDEVDHVPVELRHVSSPQIERVSIIVSRVSLEGVYPDLIMANCAGMECH
jgi:hypothetical protein